MMFFSKSSPLSLKKQSGIALLMVMLMLAILSSFSLDMADRTRKSIIQSSGINERSELYWNILTLENMSLDYMYSSINSVPDDLPPKDFIEYFYQYTKASPLTVPIPMTEFVFKVYIDDLSNFFNINSLAESFSIWGKDSLSKRSVNSNKLFSLINFLFILKYYGFERENVTDMLKGLFDRYKKIESKSFMFGSFSEIREVEGFGMLHSLFLRNIMHVVPSKLSILNLNNIDLKDVRHNINYRLYISALSFTAKNIKINSSSNTEESQSPATDQKHTLISFLDYIYDNISSIDDIDENCMDVLHDFLKRNSTEDSKKKYFDGLFSDCGIASGFALDSFFLKKDKIGYVRINSQLVYRSAVYDLISYLQYHKKKFTVIYRSFNK